MVRTYARPLLVSLALAALALLPATARASVSFTKVQLQPTSTAGGAHADTTIDIGLAQQPSSDDVKSLHLVLPQGLVGDPSAADRCSQSDFQSDACPASSKVGTAQVSAVVTTAGIDTATTAPGDVYVLAPFAGEPARLGMVVRPSAVLPLPKIFLQSGVTIGPGTGYGLSTTFDDIPRRDGGSDIRITEVKLTLLGMGPKGAFLTNPTNCRQAVMSASARSYDDPNSTATGSGSFTPTDCGRLPFSPQLSGTIGGVGLTSKGKAPPITVTIAMPAGQANLASTKISLPPILAPSASALARACPASNFAAGTCPAESRVGTAFATSGPIPRLAGPVLLVANPSSPLPRLSIQLAGLTSISLLGDVGLENARITNSFSGLPDLPLSTFQLALDASPGLVTTLTDLCAPGKGTTIDGAMTAQSGRTANASGPLAVLGCVAGNPTAVDRPRASASIRFGGSGGVLSAHFKAGRGAPALARADLTLAPGLRATTGKRGLAVTQAAARRVSRRSLHLKGRTLDVRLGKSGAASVALRWRGIRASRKVAQLIRQGKTLTFVAVLKDTSRQTTKLRVRVKPSVSRR